jgi:hypothetical protein
MTSADVADDISSVAVGTSENAIRVYGLKQDSAVRNQSPLEKCVVLRGMLLFVLF